MDLTFLSSYEGKKCSDNAGFFLRSPRQGDTDGCCGCDLAERDAVEVESFNAGCHEANAFAGFNQRKDGGQRAAVLAIEGRSLHWNIA